jgi:hypothetical protein
MAYVASGGEFNRDTNYITTRITADGRDGYPVEPDRYRLVVARACPWANRTIIVRRLLGLEDVLSIGFCGPTHDERSWTFDLDPGGVDPVLKIHYLRDAYNKRIPDYPKGITVPAIVDVPTGEVVTNDFAQITLDFSTEWAKFHREGAPQLYPEDRRDEIDEVAKRIYTEVNNGVYPPLTHTCGSRRVRRERNEPCREPIGVLAQRHDPRRGCTAVLLRRDVAGDGAGALPRRGGHRAERRPARSRPPRDLGALRAGSGGRG